MPRANAEIFDIGQLPLKTETLDIAEKILKISLFMGSSLTIVFFSSKSFCSYFNGQFRDNMHHSIGPIVQDRIKPIFFSSHSRILKIVNCTRNLTHVTHRNGGRLLCGTSTVTIFQFWENAKSDLSLA